MDKLKNRYKFAIWGAAFVLYAFFAALPVPKEAVLVSKWIKSLDSEQPQKQDEKLIPFDFSGHFGYVSCDGNFSVNQKKTGHIEYSVNRFAEFSGEASKITVKDTSNSEVFTLTNKRGYPFFRAGRTFIIHSEQSSISEVNEKNEVLWTYDSTSPITCADASKELLLIGELDGTIELLNSLGKCVYFAEPSGSRIPFVYGCAVAASSDKIAVIAGLDDQRFVMFEKSGNVWRIAHHEFVGNGFRRPVFIKFIDGEKRVVYEREGALGIYNIESRRTDVVAINDRVLQIESIGTDGVLFVVTGGQKKNLVAIRYPNNITMSAPFKSDDVFLARRGKIIFVGGGNTLAAFEISDM